MDAGQVLHYPSLIIYNYIKQAISFRKFQKITSIENESLKKVC